MMASYLSFNETEDLYHVGPPVAGAAESGMDCKGMRCQRVSDPTFELTYFRVGLTVANEWRKRLGQAPNSTWVRMVARIAPAPEIHPPSPQQPNHSVLALPVPTESSLVYNQNRACTGAYTGTPSLCEGESRAQQSSITLPSLTTIKELTVAD